jgi:hypothetical protein
MVQCGLKNSTANNTLNQHKVVMYMRPFLTNMVSMNLMTLIHFLSETNQSLQLSVYLKKDNFFASFDSSTEAARFHLGLVVAL